jgi:hypothetical protein
MVRNLPIREAMYLISILDNHVLSVGACWQKCSTGEIESMKTNHNCRWRNWLAR